MWGGETVPCGTRLLLIYPHPRTRLRVLLYSQKCCPLDMQLSRALSPMRRLSAPPYPLAQTPLAQAAQVVSMKIGANQCVDLGAPPTPENPPAHDHTPRNFALHAFRRARPLAEDLRKTGI